MKGMLIIKEEIKIKIKKIKKINKIEIHSLINKKFLLFG